MSMAKPKLIIDSEKEFLLEDTLTTIGRAPDNSVSFSDDSNVSRYHAEIERREDGFWLIDLGSFNGTTLNEEKVETEKPLDDGDVVMFGGTSEIKIVLSDQEKETEKEKESDVASSSPQPDTPKKTPVEEPKKSKVRLIMIIAAIAIVLALLFVIAAAIYYFTRETASCKAQARITKPANSDVIKKTTEVEIELIDGECVSKVRFFVGGREFASSEEPPFSVSIKPEEFSDFSDGLDQNLYVALFDEDGKRISQSNQVAIYVESIETEAPTPTPKTNGEKPSQTGEQPPKPNQITRISASDSIKMVAGTLKQFSGNSKYKFDSSFYREVKKMTKEYVSEGYFKRAEQYSDVINIQFIQEQTLDPSLGFILAMSRTKFIPPNQVEGAGLWRMSNKLVVEHSYNGLCGGTNLASKKQKCASIASSKYLKDIVIGVFKGDIIYSVAAFGMSPQEAIAWKTSLPQDRTDFWRVIRNPKQREEVIRFFAAAMVAENPKKFGLKKDKRLSELYSAYMRQ